MIALGFLLLQFALAEATSESKLYNFLHKRITTELKQDGLIEDKCMTETIKEAENYFGSTYIFLSDEHKHTELLHILQVNFLHSYYTEPSSLTSSDIAYHLEIFNNKFTLEEVFKKRTPFQGTKFFLMVKNHEDAIKKFEILWKYRIVDTVASYVENKTVFYYTYFPYCKTHCGSVGRPFLIAKCNTSTGVFSYKEKTLFPHKVKNLHRCPVNVTFTESVPSSYYGDSNKLEGWEVDLMNEIIQRLKGVPNYTVLSSRKKVYQTLTGYSRLVENSEVGGGLVVSLKGLIKTDFCVYGHSLCATWIVPKKSVPPHSFSFLIKVFPVDIWMLILLAYFAMTITIRVFFKASCHNILFKLLPYLMGTTTKTKRTSRFLGALWLWFSLTINSSYQSEYQSLLLVPDYPEQLSSTKQVLESNLKILGVTDVITDAIPFFKDRYNISKRRLRMLDRTFTYEDWVHRMTVKKDSAFLGFRETVKFNVEGTEIASKVYIPQYCIIKYLLAFVLKKNSHLTEDFVKLSNRLNENGFVTYFVRKHLSTESKLDMPKKVTTILKPLTSSEGDGMPTPIDMNKIFVVFMCYLMSISIAFIVFILEIMSKWDWRKIRRRVISELESAWSFPD